MAPLNLDMDVLRTLIAAQQLGAFNRAAKQVGRSQSAISQQIRKLEDRVGLPLFRKQGRGLIPTDAGEIVLAYARRIIDLNDEAVAALHGAAISGVVRFGLPGDFAETWLPAALGRFKRAHPTVRVEATVDRNRSLLERLQTGQLDLAVIVSAEPSANSEILATLPMAWIGAPDTGVYEREPVPLALFDPPCMFRAAAIAALDKAGMPWRIAFTSPSLSGLWAAVAAGLGVTVRTAASVPGNLLAMGDMLPALPSVHLCLSSGGRPLSAAMVRLKDILLETAPVTVRDVNNETRTARAAE
jgi:DNA-binding transcriptional LysR family regulator